MRKIFYDIMPPKALKRKKSSTFRLSSGIIKGSIIKIVAIFVIVSLSWTGLSAVYQTLAYLNDTETSTGNSFVAGTLDFQLSSTEVFSNTSLMPGESATGTISITNLGNTLKYKVKAANFTGALCDYLNLEANLDGGGVEYSGKLTELDFGPVVFEDPDNWSFSLALPASAPDDLIGETCNFNFVFYGSQTKNDLPFGMGFSDEEDASNNVKAKICSNTETRSKGYWKNHPDVYNPYLPQSLGNETVSSVSDVNGVFNNYDLSMRNKLKGQLLAMKFNIVHFGVGDYLVEDQGKTINEIAAEADDLLKQDPQPPDETLEAMKDLLDGLNQDLQIRVCRDSYIKVLIPNCGEIWWVGRHYDITWTDKNLVCDGGEIGISIWYSADSGATFANITPSTEDDGVYDWRVPLYLGDYYVPSGAARVKIIARCSANNEVLSWDISDCDFCPPIDFSLLTPEELEEARALGLIPGETISEEENGIEETTIQEPASGENPVDQTDGTSVEISGGGDTEIQPETPSNDQGGTDISEQADNSQNDNPIDTPADSSTDNSTDPISEEISQIPAVNPDDSSAILPNQDSSGGPSGSDSTGATTEGNSSSGGDSGSNISSGEVSSPASPVGGDTVSTPAGESF
jgi:predicted ribosomally synthesized peptide with SipW-like signal peptide